MTDDDYTPPAAPLSLSASAGGGIAGLMLGCTLLVSACVLMVFNVLLFSRGLRGLPIELAQIGGLIGTGGVAALGAFAVTLGARSWGAANRSGESAALGAAATAASVVGLVGWLIAGIDLMMILLS